MSCSILQQMLSDVDAELAVSEKLLEKITAATPDQLSIILNKEVKKSLTAAKNKLQSARKQGEDTLTPEETLEIDADITAITEAIRETNASIKNISRAAPSKAAQDYAKKDRDLARSMSDLQESTSDMDPSDAQIIQRRAQLEADLVRANDDLEAAASRANIAKERASERDAALKRAISNERKLISKFSQAEKRYNGARDKLLETRKELDEQLKEADIPPEKRKKIQDIQEKFQQILESQGYHKIKAIGERTTRIENDVLLNRLMADAMKVLDGETDLSVMDALLGVYYINLLSGPSTQLINFASTGINIGFDIWTDMISNIGRPGYFQLVGEMFKGTMEGIKLGWDDAANVMRNKEAIARNINKYQIPQGALRLLLTPKEQLRTEKQAGELLSQSQQKKALEVATGGFGKHMSMLLMAADAGMRRARETQLNALMIARLRNRGFKGHEGDVLTEVARYANNSEQVRKDARAQAEIDIAENDFYQDDPAAREQLINQRMFQLIENQLGDKFVSEVEKFGRRSIFTGEPYGVLGSFAHAINKFSSAFSIPIPGTKVEVPVGKFLIPFVNVPANVANEMMNYTPVGFFRGLLSKESIIDATGKKVKRDKATLFDDTAHTKFTYQQRTEAMKALFGAATMGILAAVADAYSDEEDPPFGIYGDMRNLSAEKRRSLLDAGVKPWSVKFGDSYYVFKENILSAILAPLGVWQDAKRWDKDYDEQVSLELLFQMPTAMMQSLSDASFVKSVRTLLDSFTGYMQTGKADIAKTISDLSKQTARGYIPGFIRSMTKLPGMTTADINESFSAYILGSIPFATDILGVRPALNILGEEITVGEDLGATSAFAVNYLAGERLYDVMSKDPEMRYLAKTDLTVSAFPKHNEVSLNIAGANKMQKLLITKIMKDRRSLYKSKGDIEKYAERLAFDKLTDDERYDLVKLAGPKIRADIAYVRDVMGDKPRKERQDLLDRLVKESKAEAKAELLSRYATIPYMREPRVVTRFNQRKKIIKDKLAVAKGLKVE